MPSTTEAPHALADPSTVFAMVENPPPLTGTQARSAGSLGGSSGLSAAAAASPGPPQADGHFGASHSVAPAPNRAPMHGDALSTTPSMVSVNGVRTSLLAPSHGAAEIAPPAPAAGSSPDSPKCQAQGACKGHLNAHTSTRTVCSSFSSALLSSVQLVKLVAASSHSVSAPQLADPSTSVRLDVPGNTCLFSPSPVAPAAPSQAQTADSSSASSGPFASTSRSAASSSSAAPASTIAAVVGARDHRPAAEEKDESMDVPAAARARKPPTQAEAAFEAARKMVKDASLAAAPQRTGAAAAGVHPAAAEHAICHCLAVDAKRLRASPFDDAAQLAAALQLHGATNQAALMQHILSWLVDTPSADIHTAYAQHGSVHINFASLASLGRALVAFPFLVRCAVLPRLAWHNTGPCGGLMKHQLPELLTLTCRPTTRMVQQQQAAVSALLAEMKLAHTDFWFQQERRMPPRGSGDQSSSLVIINVLPRDINRLSAEVARIHRSFKLLGGEVRVHGRNQPTLIRCSHCDKLGHRDIECPLYGGLGFRLLFKQPVTHHFLLSLVASSQARVGYLGASTDHFAPHRKVTLLFDASAEDVESIQRVTAQLAPVLAAHSELLHSNDLVQPRERLRECAGCGHADKLHECPFPEGLRLGGRKDTRASVPQASSAPASASAPSSTQLGRGRPQQQQQRLPPRSNGERQQHVASSKDSNVCKSWRLSHTCSRRDKGLTCDFEHPPDHVPRAQQSKACFEFERRGHCSKGTTCAFAHGQSEVAAAASAALLQLPKPVVAPTPVVALAGAASAAAAPASTVAALAPHASSKRKAAQTTGDQSASVDSSEDAGATKKPRQFVHPDRRAALGGSSDEMDVDERSATPTPTSQRPPNSSLSSLSSPQSSPTRTKSLTRTSSDSRSKKASAQTPAQSATAVVPAAAAATSRK